MILLFCSSSACSAVFIISGLGIWFSSILIMIARDAPIVADVNTKYVGWIGAGDEDAYQFTKEFLWHVELLLILIHTEYSPDYLYMYDGGEGIGLHKFAKVFIQVDGIRNYGSTTTGTTSNKEWGEGAYRYGSTQGWVSTIHTSSIQKGTIKVVVLLFAKCFSSVVSGEKHPSPH